MCLTLKLEKNDIFITTIDFVKILNTSTGVGERQPSTFELAPQIYIYIEYSVEVSVISLFVFNSFTLPYIWSTSQPTKNLTFELTSFQNLYENQLYEYIVNICMVYMYSAVNIKIMKLNIVLYVLYDEQNIYLLVFSLKIMKDEKKLMKSQYSVAHSCNY